VNRFDFIIHVRGCLCICFHLACFCYFSVFFFNIKKKIKKIRRENAEFLFFLLIAFHIFYVFLPDTSIHCALIEYAYI
jgi:hypothetical protein